MAEIKTKKGEVILVDDEDFDWLNQWRWWLCNKGYARRSYKGEDGKLVTIQMHRLIAGVTDPSIQVDHKNGNRLDNSRENLRRCIIAENVRNRKMHAGKSTGFKGVYAHRSGGNFHARITFDGRARYLGTFETPELAHEFYCLAADMLHGEFARHA
ncbi:hypothetical protein 23F_00011 [Ralstonia phage Gerry]|uniref:AP2/ERF domain-containing protein n=1 Tax=Ralstonia phage Gerry TaxID=2759727 RepID=A0A7G5BA50_9CAUD|nr:hypothetical protein KMC47_gp11 [Ralstonia phage Gerry]QMV33173.1 hypothetical protein 23F_00011 [Ralstonia phage Gerry]